MPQNKILLRDALVIHKQMAFDMEGSLQKLLSILKVDGS